MDTNREMMEDFLVNDAKTCADELDSRVWVYIKKTVEKREQKFEQERQMFYRSLKNLGQTVDQFAVELGDLLYTMEKMVVNYQRKGVDIERLLEVRNKIENITRNLGVRVVVPTGMRIEGKLQDQINVKHNIPKRDIQGHMVGETLSPVIFYQEKLIRMGDVIGWFAERSQDSGNSKSSDTKKK